ncbi:MAG: photosystem I assembly protein Ycf3 [Bacteroidetes bacterium ADurb.BinA261]|nr:MAG: photosystem I assembly protein Ycf3 [Bacteroidetes bacterium ADurb.BinA261]
MNKYHTQYLFSRYFLHFFIFMLPCLVVTQSIVAQTDKSAISSEDTFLDEKAQRKFDYYFFEGLNAKTQEKYAEAFDFFRHCYAIDSTNANVLVELGTFYNVLDEKSRALDLYKKAVSYDPENFYYNMLLAALSKEMGQKQQVIDVLEFLLQKYPEKIDLNMQLAQAYADNGELKKAINALNNLEKAVGITDNITLYKFQLYSMLNQKEKAFKEIEQIINENPDDPRYLILMGDLYMQDDQPNRAIEYYNKAKSINPNLPSLILSMANYYDKIGDKQASEKALLSAITNPDMEVDNKLELLSRYIAVIQQNKGDIKSVNPLFEILFEQHPHNAKLNMIYGTVLMAQDNKSEAMKQFEIYTAANPDDPAGYEQMIRASLPDSLDKVVQITEQALQFIPDAWQFYFYLGGAKYQQGKYEEALKVFQDGLKNAKIENPLVEADFYGQIGDLYHFLGNNQAAFESYEKSLKLNPQNLPVLNNYSYYLSLEKRDLDKAEQMSSITVKAEPTNPTYLDTYAWILYEQGAYTMAKIYIENAVKYSENEPSAEILEHYGDILFKTGEPEKALEQWKKAKELGSDSKTLDEKIRTGKLVEPNTNIKNK